MHNNNLTSINLVTEVVILGAGPGGYTAAFRAADLGKKVILIERYSNLGGVCLNVGCIPSKTLLHAAQSITDASAAAQFGIHYSKPIIDLDTLRAAKHKVIERLTRGLTVLAKKRQIQVLHGNGFFISPNSIQITTATESITIKFDSAIIACGSSTTRIPGFPESNPRLMTATTALNLADVPPHLLIIGGGVIGLEIATIYRALGSQIHIVETQSQLLPGCDLDLVQILYKRLNQHCHIMLNTKVVNLEAVTNGFMVQFSGKQALSEPQFFDRVLMAIGRKPNGLEIGANNAGIRVEASGFIPVDHYQRTNIAHIYAVGDVTNAPMLAHKAVHEGKVAAENVAGLTAIFDPLTIPAVAYTDPEVAWMGLTETAAKTRNVAYVKGIFPWAASGRAISMGQDDGLTKILFDKENKRILGAGIVGRNAGELIGETVLALELGADADDLGLIIHPHPSLSETLGLAADIVTNKITDMLPLKQRN